MNKESVIQVSKKWNTRLGIHEYKMRKMTWGKYAGKYIKDLPDHYLDWVIDNLSGAEWNSWKEWLRREKASRPKRNK